MTLLQTLDHYAADFLQLYGHRLRDEHRHAFSAMCRWRTKYFGEMLWQCPG